MFPGNQRGHGQQNRDQYQQGQNQNYGQGYNQGPPQGYGQGYDGGYQGGNQGNYQGGYQGGQQGNYQGGQQRENYGNSQYQGQQQQQYGNQQQQYGNQQQQYGNQQQQQYQQQSQNQDQGRYNDNQNSQSGSTQQGGRFSRPDMAQHSFGSATNAQYRYSDCSGPKKALLIGINYTGTSNQLNGCINDASNVKRFLLTQGFSENNIVMLTDDQQAARAVPTKQNILDAMRWLVKDAQPSSSLWFSYSGHGVQVEDKDGDEDDGYDEAICPLDYESAGLIIDDEMHDIMVKPLQSGVRLTALFDSCHSGTALDLPYMYSTKGLLKEPNFFKDAGEDLLSTIGAYAKGDQGAMMKGVKGLFKTVMNKDKAEQANQMSKQTKTALADVISISGCKDDQTSADAKENGQSTGAMSYAFIKVLANDPDQSYLTLLQNMRLVLQEKYSQKPQLCASHPIDTNLKFIL